MDRRTALNCLAVAIVGGVSGCTGKRVVLIGDVFIYCGALAFRVPGVAGRVIGIALILAGASLKICAESGSPQVIPLTSEQFKELHEQLKKDTRVIVKQPNGDIERLPVERD